MSLSLLINFIHCWPNNVGRCWPRLNTVLDDVALSLIKLAYKFHPTSCNIVRLLAQQCWTMLASFKQALKVWIIISDNLYANDYQESFVCFPWKPIMFLSGCKHITGKSTFVSEIVDWKRVVALEIPYL
jgi:hypothetical protein